MKLRINESSVTYNWFGLEGMEVLPLKCTVFEVMALVVSLWLTFPIEATTSCCRSSNEYACLNLILRLYNSSYSEIAIM